MRRAFPILLPLYLATAVAGGDAAAHPVTPRAAAPDVTKVARPVRARWAQRVDRPVRVYVRPAPQVPGWHPEFADTAWASFDRWSAAAIPVQFVRVPRPSIADVVVQWVDTLPGRSIGKTWRADVGGEISTARITLALRDHRGRSLSPDIRRGAILHEIGHLLGMEHVRDRRSIMYPQVWVTDVSDADRAALRSLYQSAPKAAD